MEPLPLYPFESAEIHISQASISPRIYHIGVKGQAGSLNSVIEIENTGTLDKGYLILKVVGKNGTDVGSTAYYKSLDVSQVINTEGVIIIGANDKSVKLQWHDATALSPLSSVGLFHLSLQSQTKLLGAPTVMLSLAVDTINQTVTGVATVANGSLTKPLLCTAHTTGNIIHEPGPNPETSKIRIDLMGYPEIHWPVLPGLRPSLPKNFSAMILFDANYTNGQIMYQFATGGKWTRETQGIAIRQSE